MPRYENNFDRMIHKLSLPFSSWSADLTMVRYLVNPTLRHTRLKKLMLLFCTIALAAGIGALGAGNPHGRSPLMAVASVGAVVCIHGVRENACAWEATNARQGFSTDRFEDGQFVHMTRFSKHQLRRMVAGMSLPAEMRTDS